MSTLIDSIKRLERAGDANSKANEKLHEAVVTVADFLIDTIPVGLMFDQHYDGNELLSWAEVVYHQPWNGDLYSGRELRMSTGTLRPKEGFHSCNFLPERWTEQNFAGRIAEGFLDKVIAAIEETNEEIEAATESLKTTVLALV